MSGMPDFFPFICSSYIYFSEDTRATSVNMPIYIGSVPKEHLDTFNDKLSASLRRIVVDGIDMKRMEMVINRDERQVRAWIDSLQSKFILPADS
jgi:Zn-dependent M16 (insulinase) family peptidase